MAEKQKIKRGTFIHGIAASEHLDSSGERIKVEGVDISSLTKDGVFNYEHNSDHSSQVVGKILKAKKILKRSDCEDEHQKYFWDKIKMPYLYVAGELFDAVDHSGAKDVAAMLKYDEQNHTNKDAKKLINFSIEGSRLEKRGSEITKCIARKITVTITPCNKVAIAEELKDEEREPSEESELTSNETFSFIQDIMMEKGEHKSSCRILKSTNWGEMGIGATIKNEKYTPKRTFSTYDAPDKIKVGDRIDYRDNPKAKTGAEIYGKPPKESKYGMGKSKDKERAVEDLNIDLKKDKKKNKKIKASAKEKAVEKGLIGNIKQKLSNLKETGKKRQAVDRTARKVQERREKEGVKFNPDRTVVADNEKIIKSNNKSDHLGGLKDMAEKVSPGVRDSQSKIGTGKFQSTPKAQFSAPKKPVEPHLKKKTKPESSKGKKIEKAKVDELVPEDQRALARKKRRVLAPSTPGYTEEKAKVRARIREKMQARKQNIGKGGKDPFSNPLNEIHDKSPSDMTPSDEPHDRNKFKYKTPQPKKKKKLGKYESNVHKAIAASCGLGGPSTRTQGAAIAKSEDNLQKASKNVRLQRQKVFGSKSRPTSKSPMEQKHINAIKEFIGKYLDLEVHPSGGKIVPKTGKRRPMPEDREPGSRYVKPDWRSGKFESQWNPEALIHEIAHLMLLPEGVGLKEGQSLMDKQYGDVQREHGYLQQKRSKHEVQPMAAEQLIRRVIGLPPSQAGKQVKSPDQPPVTSLEDPDQVISQRTQPGERKPVDLIRLSRNLHPENRERVRDIFSGLLKFHPEIGWQPNKSVESKVNQRRERRVETREPETERRQTAPEIREVMKSISDQAFENFDKKEELVEFLTKKLPNLNHDEIMALAKATSYVHLKKKEIILSDLIDPDLSKAQIFDFKTRKKVADTDSGEEAVQALKQQNPSESFGQGVSSHPVDVAHANIRARFGDQQPQLLEEAIARSQGGGHSEPYMFGDVHNVVHGEYRIRAAEAGKYNRPFPFPVKVNPELLQGHLGKDVHRGGPDPFMWMDQRYGATKQALKENADNPLHMSTRSDLVAHDDYIQHLNPEKHSVDMHMFSDNPSLTRKLEPGAPSVQRRMKAIEKLIGRGIPVTVVHDKVIGVPEEHNNINNLMLKLQKMGVKIKTNEIRPSKKMIKHMERATGIGFRNLMVED